MTLASIVIPTRAGAQRLPRLLQALAAQDDALWEAIVVVDGDIDDSAAVVARYAHLPVRSVIFPENKGRVAALNAGFNEARGDVLIRCDDDLVPQPDFVRLHKASHRPDGCGAIGLYVNVLPETAYARTYGRHADTLGRIDAYSLGQGESWMCWAGNVSTTREWWETVGPYDADYRAYGWEDIDWGYRLHRAGATIRLVAELETTHMVAAVTTRVRVKRAFHSGAARRTFEAKHGAGVLQPPTPQGGIWNALVRATARLAGRTTLDVAAAVVDVLANVIPAPLSRKLIGLLVESASVSGHSRPHQTSADF